MRRHCGVMRYYSSLRVQILILVIAYLRGGHDVRILEGRQGRGEGWTCTSRDRRFEPWRCESDEVTMARRWANY